jgi:tetratricopeptide (TPR) repeat protein
VNYRKFLVTLIAAGTAVLVVMFLLYGRQERYRSPYADFLETSKLRYDGGLRLRGDAAATGQAQFDEGMEFYTADRFEQAVPPLKKAVQQQPDSAAWWMYLGISHYLLKDAAAAIVCLEQANRLNAAGLRPHVRWYLAQAYLLSGSADQATPLLGWLSTQNTEYAVKADSLVMRMQLVSGK